MSDDKLSKKYMPDNWKSKARSLMLLLLATIYLVLAGCTSATPKQHYQNPESGISLEKPGNWDLNFYERASRIELKAENGFLNKDSAHIEIYASACSAPPLNTHTPEEGINATIDRIRVLYNLDSVTIVQEPIQVKSEGIEVTKSIIKIPTSVLPEDSVENQTGKQDPDIFQQIDLFAIGQDSDYRIAFLYRGNSEKLNAEAEAIIDSIRLNCPEEP